MIVFLQILLKEKHGENVEKIDKEKELVYTIYSNNEKKENSYDLDINIPYINIDNESTKKYNEEMNTFINKAKNSLKEEGKNIIYTVQFASVIEDNILSVIVRSNLKQASSAQRIIIQTYNYDLKYEKEITLEEIIDMKRLNKDSIQNKIKEEIQIEQKKVEDLKSLGYNIFERDIDNDMYEIKNTKQFFIKNGKLYIMYPYGNDAITSEMDFVII